MILLAILSSVVITVTAAAKTGYIPQARGVWPLDAISKAKDSSNYKSNGRPFDIRFGDGPTGFKETATTFLGNIRSFVEITSVKKSPKDLGSLDVGTGHLTFVTYVYFDHVINGTIMVWDGTNRDNNGVRMYVEDNDLHLSVFTRHATYGQIEKSYTYMRIVPQTWLLLGFAYNNKTGVIRTWVNDWQRWEKVGTTMEMETGGNLFLGGFPIKEGKLKHLPLSGRMSCAMLFAESLNATVVAQQLSICLKTYLSGKKEKGKEALANWPLDKNHLTTDSSPFGVHGIPWGMMEAEGPSSRSDGALFFKGEFTSNITIPNKFNLLSTEKDVTVLGYMNVAQKTDGIVMGWYGGKNASDSFRIEITKGVLRVRITDKNGKFRFFPPLDCTDAPKPAQGTPKPILCKQLEVIPKAWQFIGATYKNDLGTLTMWLNAASLSFNVGKNSIRTTGNFFLGGQPKNGVVLPAVKFRLSCVSVFGVFVERQKADHHVEACLRSWNLHEEYTNSIAFWPLDLQHGPNDRGVYHLNGNVNDLSLIDGPTGRPESSYKFSGTTKSYIEVDNDDNILDFQRGVTVLAFIYQDIPRDGVIFEWAGDSQLSNGVQLRILRGAVDVNLVSRGKSGQRVDSFTGHRIKTRQWNYVGFSYSHKKGQIKLWLNDWEPVIKSPGKHLLETRGNVYIGGRPDERYSQGFLGRISCVMVFEDALDVPDVHHAEATCTGRLMFYYNPVAIWPLSITHTNQDVGGYGNTGKAMNVGYAEGPNKKAECSMSFKGHADSGLVIPKKNVLDTMYGTSFVAWIFMERDGAKDEAVFSWDGKEGASRGITIGINKQGALFADIYRQRYVIAKPLKQHEWYLIGFSYNYYTGIFYLWAWDPEGQLNGAETFLGRVIIETRGMIHIGTKPPKGPYVSFKGRISCVMLFNKPAHIQKLVAAGKECEVNLLTTSKGHRIVPGKGVNPAPTHHLGSIVAPTVILILLGCIVVFALIFYKKRQSSLDMFRTRLWNSTSGDEMYHSLADESRGMPQYTEGYTSV
ncbi:uncharacterized protein LOC135503180 isoform X2 [Lineus longissimus]|uniref:uncharacterized protein LOC135503180 isoform X2 n=1 Tax=Lineus longissimus TaxID=88925 RepID=UPI002B4D08A3